MNEWMMNDDDPKRFCDFFFIEINFRWNKHIQFSKICEKLFSIGKKSDFKFQNRGYFGQKNMPQISWNFGHNYFTERWFTIFRQKISKTFLSGQKSNFKFQNRGYFAKKNLSQMSWNFGHNYFTERWFTIFRQKISKTFLSGQKSNFNFQNRGYFAKKKCFANLLKLQS